MCRKRRQDRSPDEKQGNGRRREDTGNNRQREGSRPAGNREDRSRPNERWRDSGCSGGGGSSSAPNGGAYQAPNSRQRPAATNRSDDVRAPRNSAILEYLKEAKTAAQPGPTPPWLPEVDLKQRPPPPPSSGPPDTPDDHARRLQNELATFREEGLSQDGPSEETRSSPGESFQEAAEDGEAVEEAVEETIHLPARSRWLDEDSDDANDDTTRPPHASGPPAAAGLAETQADTGGLEPGEISCDEQPFPSRPMSEHVRVDPDDAEGVTSDAPLDGDAPKAAIGGPSETPGREFSITAFIGVPGCKSCRSVDSYEKLHKIDEGTYGVVYKARDRQSGDIVALKQVKLLNQKEGFPATALREINVLLSLQHENIVNVREMVVGNSMDKIFMAMDFMDHDLKGFMVTMAQKNIFFTASEVKRVMLDLLSALHYCHEHWVLHRDIKTSNMLVSSQGVVCLCDFGLARMYGEPLKPYTNMVVTLWYRPPELLLGGDMYGPALDVWSLGCVFAELLTLKPLLPGRGELDQIDKIFKLLGTPTEAAWPGVSQLPHMRKVQFKPQPFNRLRDHFKRGASFTSETALSDNGLDLMSRMLCLNPEERITTNGCLEHPYFHEHPAPKAYHLMPTYPSSHQSKTTNNARSVNDDEAEQRLLFHQDR